MPNRIIKESIRTSKTVNSMTDFQFRVWVYLITYVDDYGRGSADPELIKGFVFPRRKRLSESDIEKALAELAGMGCISLYKVGGESYFCFPNWGNHQRIQTKKSKFPPPEAEPPHKTGIHGESRWATVDNGEPPPESNPIQSESESNTCPEQAVLASVPEEPPVILFTLNDGAEYPVSREQCREWEGLYPAVDVMQQLRSMKGWLDANPKRRKTKNGITRFVNGWLAKEQNRGGTPGYSPPEPEKDSAPYGTGEMLPDTQRVHLPENATLDDVLALIP